MVTSSLSMTGRLSSVSKPRALFCFLPLLAIGMRVELSRLGQTMLNFICSQVVLFFLLLRGAESNSAETACGHRHTFSHRIIGGKKADEGEWPWQASIRKNRLHVCGGSLVSPQWVVTAAHCFVGPLRLSEYQINLGEYELPDPAPSMISSTISKIIVHPYFAGEGLSADIALVRLEKPVNFSWTVLPICLPSSLDHDIFSAGMSCWATGWGQVSLEAGVLARTLQELEVQIIDVEACDEMYHNKTEDAIIPDGYRLIYKDMICAGYPEGKKDTCQGDSGGPLACKLNDTWFLAGVVSFGFECAKPNRPGVYTRTTSFMDWIQNTMTQNVAPSGCTDWVNILLLPFLLVSTGMLL